MTYLPSLSEAVFMVLKERVEGISYDRGRLKFKIACLSGSNRVEHTGRISLTAIH